MAALRPGPSNLAHRRPALPAATRGRPCAPRLLRADWMAPPPRPKMAPRAGLRAFEPARPDAENQGSREHGDWFCFGPKNGTRTCGEVEKRPCACTLACFNEPEPPTGFHHTLLGQTPASVERSRRVQVGLSVSPEPCFKCAFS